MEDIENIKKQLFDAIFKRQDRNEVEQILNKYPEIVDEHIELESAIEQKKTKKFNDETYGHLY